MQFPHDCPTCRPADGPQIAARLSAVRLSALFKEWDAVNGEGPEAGRRRAAIVNELTRYYPEEAGLARIGELLGMDTKEVAAYREMARDEIAP